MYLYSTTEINFANDTKICKEDKNNRLIMICKRNKQVIILHLDDHSDPDNQISNNNRSNFKDGKYIT